LGGSKLQLPSAPATQIPISIPPQSAQIPSQPTTQIPEPEPVDFSTESIPDDGALDTIGLALQTAFEQQGLPLKFVPPAIRDHRYNRFFFFKPPSIPYAKLEGSILRDVISHAGHDLDPTQKPVTRPRMNGGFEVAILRPQAEWDTVPLLSSLPNWEHAAPLLSSRAPDRYMRLLDRLHNTSPIAAASPLLLPFGVDMTGQPYLADLSSGFIAVGNPNGGKSNAIKNIVNALCLLMPPSLLRFSGLWDLKDGVTLSRYAGLSWVDRVYTSVDDDEVKEYFASLRLQKQWRGQLFTKAGVENLMEYNALKNTERGRAMEQIDPEAKRGIMAGGQMSLDSYMPWLYTIIDEIIPMARVVDETPALIGEQAREWRAAGIPLGITTQYARKDLGLDPSARVFGCTIVFNISEQGAQLVLGGDDACWSRMATQLPMFGSAIVKQSGGITPIQTYFTPRKDQEGMIGQIFKPWTLEQLSKRPIAQPDVFSTSEDPDWTAYQRLLADIASASAKGQQYSLTRAVDAIGGEGTAKRNWAGGLAAVDRVLKAHNPELLAELKTKAGAKR